MKKILIPIILTTVLLIGCNRTGVNPSGITAPDGRWTCFYYSTCPANPLSAAPCYQYQSTDTSIFGNGAVSIQIGNNKIYRNLTGSFKYTPYSYLYSQNNDTLTYQQINSSTWVIVNGNQVADTVKITSVTNSLLLLEYISTQFSTTVEIDSLRR